MFDDLGLDITRKAPSYKWGYIYIYFTPINGRKLHGTYSLVIILRFRHPGAGFFCSPSRTDRTHPALQVHEKKCDFRIYLYIPTSVPLVAFYSPASWCRDFVGAHWPFVGERITRIGSCWHGGEGKGTYLSIYYYIRWMMLRQMT